MSETPAPLARLIEKATLEQRRDTARALAKPRSVKRVLKMAERALARAERTIAEAGAILPPPTPVACGPGCPYCCHIRLTGSAPEILLLLAHIRATWDADAIARLTRKVRNTDLATRGKADGERARQRLPCPLLQDGSCAAHAVRPLSCRAVASVDAGACRAAYASRMAEGVPMYEPQYIAANAVGYGMYAGLADAGFRVENIELVAALADGLERADIAQAWLEGKNGGQDPFAAAK